MVLVPSSAQYAFLQTLARTYVWMLADLQSTACIANPQIFTDCTDLSQYYNNGIPHLPYTDDFYSKNDPDQYDYDEYTTVTFHGFNPASFKPLIKNLTNAATSTLTITCVANSTCYNAYNNTAGADDVITALATTNINTISSLITKNSKKYYFPQRGWAYGCATYLNAADLSSEVYGIHDSVAYGFSGGVLNASAFLEQQALGQLLYGGAQIYESLIHVAAIGSWSPDLQKQSNINLTGTQIFKKITDGGLDSRSLQRDVGKRKTYENKWQIWLDESKGIVIPNKSAIIAEIQETARLKKIRPSLISTQFSTQVCTPPTDLTNGVNWLSSLVNTGCQYEGYLSAARNLLSVVPAASLNPNVFYPLGALQDYGRTVLGTTLGQVISFCGGGVNGFPCFQSEDAWLLGAAVGSEVQTVAQLLIDAAEYDNPVGAALGVADLFCGLAPFALKTFQEALNCCSNNCNSLGCQAATKGCVPQIYVC